MSYTAEEKIKLAGEDSKDRLYEAKQNQKAIRILTVAAYVLCVSLVAIMLSLYYIFFWDPSTNPMQQKTQTIGRFRGVCDSRRRFTPECISNLCFPLLLSPLCTLQIVCVCVCVERLVGK